MATQQDAVKATQMFNGYNLDDEKSKSVPLTNAKTLGGVAMINGAVAVAVPQRTKVAAELAVTKVNF